MRRESSIPTIAGLLVFFMLCFVPGGQAQSAGPCVPVSQNPAATFQLGLKCNFTSASGATGAFTAAGLSYWQVVYVPSGTVSGATLSLDSSATGLSGSWSTGGIIPSATIGAMTSAGSYANSSATTPTNYLQLTPTITGTGTVTVIVFGYTNNPSGSGSTGGSVTVTNFPTTQNTNIQQMGGVTLSLFATLLSAQSATGTAVSGPVRIPDFAGTGTLEITGASITGSPSGCQIALAYEPNTGSPVTAAQATISFTPGNSTQLFPVNPTNPTGDQWVATYSCGTYPTAGTISVSFAPTTPSSIVGSLPAGTNVIGAVTTQPTGFGTLIGFQQAVTASAVALASNAAHSFCVQALPTNTINVYVGPSGITTSTGLPLQPGQTACWALSNTNLVYVIASSTGASVAVTGT